MDHAGCWKLTSWKTEILPITMLVVENLHRGRQKFHQSQCWSLKTYIVEDRNSTNHNAGRWKLTSWKTEILPITMLVVENLHRGRQKFYQSQCWSLKTYIVEDRNSTNHNAGRWKLTSWKTEIPPITMLVVENLHRGRQKFYQSQCWSLKTYIVEDRNSTYHNAGRWKLTSWKFYLSYNSISRPLMTRPVRSRISCGHGTC